MTSSLSSKSMGSAVQVRTDYSAAALRRLARISKDTVLREKWPDFELFEHALKKPGPWIAGIDRRINGAFFGKEFQGGGRRETPIHCPLHRLARWASGSRCAS